MKKLPDDPRFKHVDYRHTDVAATWARVRREQKAEAEANKRAAERVVPINRSTLKGK